MLSATRLVLGQKYVPVRIVFAILTLEVLLSFRFFFAVIFVVLLLQIQYSTRANEMHYFEIRVCLAK